MTPEQITEQAEDVGRKVARRIFADRGNNSEVHLSESQLALIVSTAYEAGLNNGMGTRK